MRYKAPEICGIKNATSSEFESSGTSVIDFIEGQSKDVAKGGSMRLGAYDCELKPKSLARDIYGQAMISERHRHRLEVNNDFVSEYERNGLTISGKNPALDLVELIELESHPFFVACQYHPEFKSRPFSPHPLFASFILASMGELK